MHVFITNGLISLSKTNITILEIGFGTGLNAILSYEKALQENLTIKYIGLELYPLSSEIIASLNYGSILKAESSIAFKKMHQLPWNKEADVSSFFTINKINADLNIYEFTEKFDLVYFDAFGPDVQPEMWSTTNFSKIFNALNKDGILVTYSSKGLVKRNLRDAGFIVQRLQGPPGKRHMLRALKA